MRRHIDGCTIYFFYRTSHPGEYVLRIVPPRARYHANATEWRRMMKAMEREIQEGERARALTELYGPLANVPK